MLSNSLFLIIVATLAVFSRASPTKSNLGATKRNPSPESVTEAEKARYARRKVHNPWPAGEPYIIIEADNSKSTLKIRGFLDTLKGVKDILFGGKEVKPVEVSSPSCKNNAECLTNTAIFDISLVEFIDNHRAKGLNSPPLTYSSDGCSVPPEVAKTFKIDPNFPYGYEFLSSCYRHDFGYRNFKAQGRLTDVNRELLDDVFKDDLLNQCNSQFPGANIFNPSRFLDKRWCDTVANVYYKFVRLCGGGGCKLEIVMDLFKEIPKR